LKKILRNTSTPELRELWRKAEETAAEVATWPDWKRAGINVADRRIPAVKVSLYLPEDVFEWLKAEADREERSLSWVVAQCLRRAGAGK